MLLTLWLIIYFSVSSVQLFDDTAVTHHALLLSGIPRRHAPNTCCAGTTCDHCLVVMSYFCSTHGSINP